jgi:hypothetical protein
MTNWAETRAISHGIWVQPNVSLFLGRLSPRTPPAVVLAPHADRDPAQPLYSITAAAAAHLARSTVLPPFPRLVSPLALPMSSSAAALAWRRTLRDALLRGSAWRGAAPARYASTASASGAAAADAAAAAPKKVPPPPRKVTVLAPAATVSSAFGHTRHVQCSDLAELPPFSFSAKLPS